MASCLSYDAPFTLQVVDRSPMANDQHLAILKGRVDAWNMWRVMNPDLRPDLAKADLRGQKLFESNPMWSAGIDVIGPRISAVTTTVPLSTSDVEAVALLLGDRTVFGGVDLRGALLRGANLSGADLRLADAHDADLEHASLQGALLTLANLKRAFLPFSNLTRANLRVAHLDGADLTGAKLRRTDLTFAMMEGATLGDACLLRALLSRVRARGAYLARADLRGADASDADLQGANLNGARLCRTILQRTNLSDASLRHVDAANADLCGANLRMANLSEAHLTGAHLRKANLTAAIMHDAKLTGADLSHACLTEATLFGADLRGANLREANLRGVTFREADLREADLRGANLQEAALVHTDLRGAKLSGCRIYGASAWDVLMDETTQQSDLLIISEEGARDPMSPERETQVTVDSLEMGQLVHLLLHDKVRTMLETVGKKGVLLLGRFSDGRMHVLERLKDALRESEWIPIVFNFERLEKSDYTETVRTLAGLSHFVIADITAPRSVGMELQATVPEFMIPFVLIIEAGDGTKPEDVDVPALFGALWAQNRDRILGPLVYRSIDELIPLLNDQIINPAEARFRQLVARKGEKIPLRRITAPVKAAPPPRD